VLEPYAAEHRGVETFFKECFLDDIDQRLRQAQLDLVIRPRSPKSAARTSYVRTAIYEEDLLFLPRAASGAATDGGPVRLRDVADETFVLCSSGCGLANTTRELFKEAGAVLREYSGYALSLQVMQDWADMGIGATIVPSSKILPSFRATARRLMLAPRTPARVTFEAVWMKNVAYPTHVAALHRHFRSRVPALLAGEAR
jgi:DNA-binding transcriptional LysR family regulator